jgi:hypothetical protein
MSPPNRWTESRNSQLGRERIQHRRKVSELPISDLVRSRVPYARHPLDRFHQSNSNLLPALPFHTQGPCACQRAGRCVHWWYLELRPRGRIRAVSPTSNAATPFGPDKAPPVRHHRCCRLRYAHRRLCIFVFLLDAAIRRRHVEIVAVAIRRHRPPPRAGRRCHDRLVAVAIRFHRTDISLDIGGRCRERAFRRSLGNWRARPPYPSVSQAASVSRNVLSCCSCGASRRSPIERS